MAITERTGCVQNKNGKRVPVYKQVIHTKSMVNPVFMKRHRISSQSLPHRIIEVFMSFCTNKAVLDCFQNKEKEKCQNLEAISEQFVVGQIQKHF